MRFRRRRKPRVQWLKNTLDNVELNADRLALLTSATEEPAVIESLQVGNFVTPVTVDFPLFLDASPEEAQTGAPASVIGKQGLNFNQAFGYRLRRIVGKLLLVAGPNDPQKSGFPAVHIKLGIMVRRVDADTGVPLAAGQNSDTMAFQNVTDPWIWQRNFYLNTGLNTNPHGSLEDRLLDVLPASTTDCGGTKDGPAFDIKTARRLGPEERTFLNMTIVGLPLGDAASLVQTDGVFVYFHMDYRALATVTSTAGNRRNASR